MEHAVSPQRPRGVCHPVRQRPRAAPDLADKEERIPVGGGARQGRLELSANRPNCAIRWRDGRLPVVLCLYRLFADSGRYRHRLVWAHLRDHRRYQSKQRRGLSLSVESDPGHIALSLTVHKWVRTEYLHKLRPCLPNPTPLHRLLKRLPEGFQKQPPIIITLENVLPAVAPVLDVVDGARILHSHRARHARKITIPPQRQGPTTSENQPPV